MRRSLKRILAVIQKESIQLFRDRRLLMLIMGLPLIELFLFAYAVHLRVEHIPTAVADMSLDSSSRGLVSALQVSGYFDMVLYVADEAQVVQAIDRGQVKAGVVIPPGFGSRVERGDAQALIILDGSDSFIVNSGYSSAVAIAQTQSVALTLEKVERLGAAGAGVLPLQTSIRVLYNSDLRDMIFILPGLSAMLLQTLAISVASVPMVRERELGTIEQILATPTRPLELVIGKLVAQIAVVVIDLLIVFLLSIFWFGVPFQGSVGVFAGLALLFVIAGLGMGLLVSTVARTQRQAQQINSMLMLFSMLLTGIVYPRAPMPLLVQFVGDLIPLTFFVRITRGIITKGVGLSFLWSDALALVIYSVVIVALAAVTFRKRLD